MILFTYTVEWQSESQLGQEYEGVLVDWQNLFPIVRLRSLYLH